MFLFLDYASSGMKDFVYIFRERLIAFQKSSLLFEKWTLLEAPVQAEFFIFLWKFVHVFFHNNIYKSIYRNLFLFCFSVLPKNSKAWYLEAYPTPVLFTFSLISSDWSKLKKFLDNLLLTLVRRCTALLCNICLTTFLIPVALCNKVASLFNTCLSFKMLKSSHTVTHLMV